MSITKLNPYLNFNGTASDAIALYESALGATVEHIMRFNDVPDMPAPAGMEQRVMHATLRIGASGVIMISDTSPHETVSPEGNSFVCLHLDAVPDMEVKFAALAEGGTITMPLADTFWGARFGLLTDRYGIRWMFNCDLKA